MRGWGNKLHNHRQTDSANTAQPHGSRDLCLQKAGFRVLRFWINLVLQKSDAVVDAIWIALQNVVVYPIPTPPQHRYLHNFVPSP
ncbi:MAG: DUF559 domain-containing protein [Gallionella sp.]|nr:DUF559 domain-containing protein [Gallionella sp.]